MKKNKLKTYKKIKNTRKFSLGKPITKSGYESAKAVDTTPLAINEGYKGYTQEGNSISSGIAPSIATTGATIGTSLYSLASGTTSAAQAAATNIANAGFSQAGNLTLNGASALGDVTAGIAGQSMSSLADSATNTLASKAATQLAGSGGSVAKAGLSKLGSAMAIAQMAKGAFDMGSTLVNYGDRLSDSEIAATRDVNTNMRNGVAYQELGSIDAAGVNRYTDAQNKASRWGMINAGGEIGAGVGAIAGSAFGPLGTVVGGLAGTVLGGLTNWGLDALFGFGRRRKRKIMEAQQRIAQNTEATNLQNESVAASQGLRNMYNETHKAALGKNPGERWSTGDYTGIQTPSGPTYGTMQGLASPDEGEIDMSTGETNYNGSANPMVRDSKADVVPVGTADNDGQYFDNYIGIPGHKKDIDGIAFADKARPFFKANEMIKIASQNIDKELQKNENHKTRDDATKKYTEKRLKQKQQEYQQQYQQNSQYIQDLVMRQSEQATGRMYSCGKTPRFISGKHPYVFGRQDIALDRIADFWKNYDDSAINELNTYKDLNWSPAMNAVDYGVVPREAILSPRDKALSKQDVDQAIQDTELPKPNTKSQNGLGLPAWAGLVQGLPYALQTQIAANRQQPYAANSYVSNANQRAALDILGRLGYDNTQDKRALLNTARQNRYNILNTGGLSQGQKAMLIQNGLNQLALGRAVLNQDAYNKNAAYKQAYASEMAKYGEASAARAQQALAAQQEAFRQAVGAKQKLQEQARKNWYTIGRQALEDYNTKANAEAMRNLYDRQIAVQESGIKPKQDRNKKQNNTNPYSLDYIKSKAQYDTFIKNYIPLTDLFK